MGSSSGGNKKSGGGGAGVVDQTKIPHTTGKGFKGAHDMPVEFRPTAAPGAGYALAGLDGGPALPALGVAKKQRQDLAKKMSPKAFRQERERASDSGYGSRGYAGGGGLY